MKFCPRLHHEGEVQIARGAGDCVAPNVMEQEVSRGSSNQHVPNARLPKQDVHLHEHRGGQWIEWRSGLIESRIENLFIQLLGSLHVPRIGGRNEVSVDQSGSASLSVYSLYKSVHVT